MTRDELLQWLRQGPMVQEGPKWVHENQAFWDQNPTLQLSDGSSVRFDDWVGQGPMVTDGTSWMTQNQFLWNHRSDADQSPWLRQDDGTMIHLDQWLQQGPMVQDGSTWVHENQFYWNHQGEQWVFVPNSDDRTTGTMVPLDQWLQEGPMVIAPDGTQMTWNRFIYENGDGGSDPWVIAPTGQVGQVMRQSEFVRWGPPTTGPDGKTVPEGQFMLNHPDDPHNPWVYLPFDPADPYSSYLDPQWLQREGADVSVSAPLTAMTLSDYMGKVAFDIDAMKGLGNDLYNFTNEVLDTLLQLRSDMQGITGITYTPFMDPEGSIENADVFGSTPDGRSMRASWDSVWATLQAPLPPNYDVDGLFAVSSQNLISMANGLYDAAEMAWQGEKYTVDSIQKAARDRGFHVDVTMPDEPNPTQPSRGPR